jgi:hypothetical protein
MLLNSDTLKVFLFFMAEVTINQPGFQHGKKRGIFLISAQGSMAAKVWSSDASFQKAIAVMGSMFLGPIRAMWQYLTKMTL